MLGTFDLAAMFISERLGLYRALAGSPATSAELAERAGTNERYVREWLEQQAAAGLLEVEPRASAASGAIDSQPAVPRS